MKSTLYLLDTSVLLALVRGKDLGQFIRYTFALEDPSVRSLISIVTHGEILALADRNAWQLKKREALGKMLDSLVTVDLSAGDIVKAYTEIDRLNRTASAGARQLSDNDLWIAATAKAAHASLLTTDGDFLHLHPHYLIVEYVSQNSKLATTTLGSQPRIK
jgi:tRNA(fMet)-specific endonuclease VapC